MEFHLRRRFPVSFFLVLSAIAFFFLLILFEKDVFLITFFSIVFLMLRDCVENYMSCYPYRSSKEYEKRFKRVNQQWYGFLCDPTKRSNPSSFQMNFYCSRSRKEVETPLSATMILRANDGFRLNQDDFGRFYFGAFDSYNADLSGSYLTFKMLTKRVQATYFNWNDQVFKAGCSLFLEDLGEGNELTEKDKQIFLDFSKNYKFSNLIKGLKRYSKILDFEESDIRVMYAIRCPFLKDFVIFAENQKTRSIEKLIYNTSTFGFEKVQSELEYDPKKNMKDGKLSLLFMTYDSSRGLVQTLTVYRTANGKIEKKILNVRERKFDVLPREPIICRYDENGEDQKTEARDEEPFQNEIENGFEIVSEKDLQ